MMELYKVLSEDGTPYHGGAGQWPVPVHGEPGPWLEVAGPLEACVHGLHLYRQEDLVRWLGPVIWRAESDGERIESWDKVVVRRARLISRCTGWTESAARLFACDCAERALTWEREAGREPDARSWSAIEVARLHARGEATDDELAAAGDAAGAAAWAAAWAAAGASARLAAWAAARDAAWASAGAAAEAAAGASAWSAAWAAAGASAWASAGAAAEAAAGASARLVAWAAARDAEMRWQTDRLFSYLAQTER